MGNEDQQTQSKKDMTTFSLYSKLNAGEPLPDNTGIPIEGFCVHDGLFKEVIEIPESELSGVEKTVVNAQLRKNHGNDIEDVIGRVTLAKLGFDEIAQKKGVYYQAFIDQDENKIAGKVAKGLINDVSIGFDLFPTCSKCGEDFRTCPHYFDEAHIVAKDLEVYEVSLVTRGADADASAGIKKFMANFDYKLKDKVEDEIEEEINFIEGGKSMAEQVDMDDLVTKLTDSEKATFKAEQLAEQKTNEAKELAEKLKAAEEAKAALEEEKKTLVSDKEKLEEDKKTATGKLSEREEADKKAKVSKIVDAEIARELTKESDKDTRVEELMGLDDTGLDIHKDMVEKFEKKVEQEDKPKIDEIHEFDKPTNDNEELDIKDPKVQQECIHTIFKYNNVFKGDPKKAIKDVSYMGYPQEGE